MVALVVSKLILVIIFVIGLGVLTDGLGEVNGTGTGASATQSITQTIVGTLILLMAGFAPWLAIKLVHFGGEHFGQIHGQARSALAGAQSVAAAPRKARSLAGGVGELRTRWIGPVTWRSGASPGDQAQGTSNGSVSTVTSGTARSPGAGSRGVGASAGGVPAGGGAGRGRTARCGRGRGRCGQRRQDGGGQGDRPHRRGVVGRRPHDSCPANTVPDIDSPPPTSTSRQREVTSRWVSARWPPARTGSGETCAAWPVSAVPPEGPAPVRFASTLHPWTPARALDGALSLAPGAAVCVVVLGLVAGGGIGLVASGLVWVPLLVATFVSWQGLAPLRVGSRRRTLERARRRPDRASTERECRCHARREPWPFPATPPRCASTRTPTAGRAWCTTRIARVSRSPWRSPIRPTSCSRPPISRVG